MDKTLVCQDCGTSFTFTDDDQRYHAEKGYTEPKRCPSCRANRRVSSGGGRRVRRRRRRRTRPARDAPGNVRPVRQGN